jgi:hypothetical protein
MTRFLVTYLSVALAMLLAFGGLGYLEASPRLRTWSSRFCWLAGCALGSLLWPLAMACFLFPSILPWLLGLASRVGRFLEKIFWTP